MSGRQRDRIRRVVKYFGLAAAAAMFYVLLDFAIDFRPAGVQDSYRFEIANWAEDQARILRQDNLYIVVIKRSAETLARLRRELDHLQDPDSSDSEQPVYAKNVFRSRDPGWFVGYAIGTDLGCVIEALGDVLKETCSDARYDFAGRALSAGRRFRNLTVPDYTFTEDYRYLTIKP